MSTEYCASCGRKFYTLEGRYPVGKPHNHHHPPRIFRRRKKYKLKTYKICNDCHKHIHKIFSNKDLFKMSFEEVVNNPKMQRFITWINKFDVPYFLRRYPRDEIELVCKVDDSYLLVGGKDIKQIHRWFMMTEDDFIPYNCVEKAEYKGEVYFNKDVGKGT